MTIAIVGASGGIGSLLARELKAAGSDVVQIGRSAERMEPIGKVVAADASRPGELQAALETAGPIDGIVNCAGSLLLKPAHLTTDAEWEQVMTANLTTAFATVRAGAKAMMQSGGSIVLCSSAAARTGLANHEAIAAAKAGVIGLTLSAAASYAGRNIRVNCVAPGLVETPLTAKITGNEASLKVSSAMHALGRIGKAADVVSAILWLLDPRNSWITGQVIGVDGGLGTIRPK